jgi:hypothetical protein
MKMDCELGSAIAATEWRTSADLSSLDRLSSPAAVPCRRQPMVNGAGYVDITRRPIGIRDAALAPLATTLTCVKKAFL